MKSTYSIHGMTCSSCEVLIERKLGRISGIEKVKVNHALGTAEIEMESVPTLQELQDAIKADGYTIHPLQPALTSKVADEYLEAAAALIIIVSVYLMLSQLDILPNLSISDGMTYPFIFAIGLVAAMSTCLAVTGGLLLAISNKYNEQHPNITRGQRLRPHIFFNVGRIAGYSVFGALVGALGSFIALSPQVSNILSIVASAVMILLGLQLLNIFPIMRHFSPKMPKFLAHKIYDASGNVKPSTPLTLGALTFFLPCGFTQALQLYVLSTADPVKGALTMFFFALGTAPALFSIGALSGAKGSWKQTITRFAGALVILLGILTITNNLAFAGFTTDVAPGPIAQVANGKQVITMTVNGLDYSPDQFTIKQGIPVEWRIDGNNAQGCAQIISVPKLGLTKQLQKGTPTIISFTPEQVGNIRFSCAMGMAGPGTFQVVP